MRNRKLFAIIALILVGAMVLGTISVLITTM